LLGGGLLSLRVVATPPAYAGVLDPDGRNPVGAGALAELLRAQGIDVEVVHSRYDAVRALRGDSTLVTADPYNLSDEAVVTLLSPADRVVLISSSARMLRLYDLGSTAYASGVGLTADCDVPQLARIGTIDPDRLFDPTPGVTGCFAGGDGASAVLVDEAGPHIALVEGSRLLSNEHLADNGNAALGLALLGQTRHVVWYVPSFADSDIAGTEQETLGSLTPGWVTPAILLLMMAGLAAALWRGRRFGPLVAENLPVTVRASETMHGRARLTARSADSAHAAAALQDGTVRRLAKRLGLGDRAAAHEVADSASDRLRIARGTLHELLAGAPAENDRDLVDQARRLAELEDAVDDALHTPASPAAPTERNAP
ncbi:MAG: DUF4350 domain-containing protein, partial [Microbacterium sp.]